MQAKESLIKTIPSVAKKLKDLRRKHAMKVLVTIIEHHKLSQYEIIMATRLSQPLVSRYLNSLQDQNLITAKKSGRHVFYTPNINQISTLIHHVNQLETLLT